MQITKDTKYYLEAFVTDLHGNPVEGLTLTYTVIKCEDNTIVDSDELVDVGNGIYQGSYVFDTVGQYRIIYDSPYDYTDMVETVVVTEPVSFDVDKLNRILGLSQHNYRIFGQKHDKNGNLTFAKIRLYHTPEDLEDQVNHFAEYEVNTAYSKNNVSDYSVKKIL
jgi:hypothetical protein